MKKLYLPRAWSAWCLLALTLACQEIEEFDGIATNAEFALPLVNTEVTIQDFLDATNNDLSFVVVEADGKMKISYADSTQIDLDKSMLESIPSITFPLPEQDIKVPMSFNDDVRLSKAIFRTGSVSFAAGANRQESLTVSVSFPSISKDGVPLQLTGRMVYTGSQPIIFNSDSINLEQYQLEVINDSIQVKYTAVTDNGESVKLDGIQVSIKNWYFSYVQGIWDNITYGADKDSLDFKSFNDLFDGDLRLVDPQLKIRITNSAGVPIMAKVHTLSVMTAGQEELDLESDELSSGIHLLYPQMHQQGQQYATELILTPDNSNLDEVFNNHPRWLNYELSMISDPQMAGAEGYITDESRIKVNVEAEIPLHGSIAGLGFRDTLDADLQGLEDFEKAEFKLITENGIPLEALLQVYFADRNENIIDSLFGTHATVIRAAPVDASGEVTQPINHETLVNLTADRLDVLRSSYKVIIDAKFNSYDAGQSAVKINATQGLRVKIGVKAGIR